MIFSHVGRKKGGRVYHFFIDHKTHTHTRDIQEKRPPLTLGTPPKSPSPPYFPLLSGKIFSNKTLWLKNTKNLIFSCNTIPTASALPLLPTKWKWKHLGYKWTFLFMLYKLLLLIHEIGACSNVNVPSSTYHVNIYTYL